jgi:hypothetical protein
MHSQMPGAGAAELRVSGIGRAALAQRVRIQIAHTLTGHQLSFGRASLRPSETVAARTERAHVERDLDLQAVFFKRLGIRLPCDERRLIIHFGDR